MTGPLVATVRTAPATLAEWITTRGTALFRALIRRGLSFEMAASVVPMILTHWKRETGAVDEYNNNPGNIRAGQNHARMLLGGLDYNAYATIDEGVEAYLHVLEGRYRKQLHDVLVGQLTPLGWYDANMHQGYHPWSQQALTEYQQIYTRLTRGLTP